MLTRGQLSADGTTRYGHEYTPGPVARPESLRRVACPVRLMRATIERLDSIAHGAGMTRTRMIELAVTDAAEIAEWSVWTARITESS